MQPHARLKPLINALSGSSRFLALFGPGTTDHLISSGEAPVPFLQAAAETLRQEGFARVVVYSPHQSLTCLHGSLHPAGLETQLTVWNGRSSQQYDRMRILEGGPLQDLQVYTPALTLPDESQEVMGDLFALRTMDRLMHLTIGGRTAVIFTQAAQSLAFFEDQRLLGGYLEEWVNLPLDNTNRCLMLFENLSRAELPELADTLPVPALSRLLRQAGTNPKPEALVEIGAPTADELTDLLETVMQNLSEVPDSSELLTLARKLSAENLSLAEWLNRLEQLDEITYEAVRRKGWFSASSGSGISAMERLNKMVGLEDVKTRIAELTAWLKVSRERLKDTGNNPEPLLHMIFSGAPGTGKTTAARLIGEIFHEAGILKRGHLVEATTADLVGEHVGGTAVKTNQLVDRALDGVLFIDEAYMLTENGRGGFGLEALETLMARMENERGRLVVIAAGYGERMQRFRSANPGLERRIPEENVFEFSAYSTDQLLQILLAMLQDRQLTVTLEFAEQLKGVVQTVWSAPQGISGNAGEMRNLADALDRRSAIRIVQGGLPYDTPLCIEDLPQNYRQAVEPADQAVSPFIRMLQWLAEEDDLVIPEDVVRQVFQQFNSAAQTPLQDSEVDSTARSLYGSMKRRLADRLFRQSRDGNYRPDTFSFQLSDLSGLNSSVQNKPAARKTIPVGVHQRVGRLSGFPN